MKIKNNEEFIELSSKLTDIFFEFHLPISKNKINKRDPTVFLCELNKKIKSILDDKYVDKLLLDDLNQQFIGFYWPMQHNTYYNVFWEWSNLREGILQALLSHSIK